MTKAKVRVTIKRKSPRKIKECLLDKIHLECIEKQDHLTFDGKIVELKQVKSEPTNYIEQRFDILGAVRLYKPCNMRRADSPMGFYARDLNSGLKVILKPCGSGFCQSNNYEPHQVIIDEWKELVGLEKMGTNYFVCASNYVHNDWNKNEDKNLYWSLEHEPRNFEFFDYNEVDDRNSFANVKPLKIWIVIQLKEGMTEEAKTHVIKNDMSKEMILEAAKIQAFRHVMTSDNRFNNVLVRLNEKGSVEKMMSIDEERFFENAKKNAKTLTIDQWYIKEMKRIMSIKQYERIICPNKDKLIEFLDEIRQQCVEKAKSFKFFSLEDNINHLKKALQSIEK